MKTIEFCMYCGERVDLGGDHTTCKVMIDKFREDLKRTPEGEKFKVFQAAENGAYGVAKKRVRFSFDKELKKL